MRDAFVETLKTLVAGWERTIIVHATYPGPLSEKYISELQVLVEKTNRFLRDEFGESI